MNATKPARFPFSAVVGHDDAKLALLLAAIDPAIGGVLLRGQKGSAKTTLARGLAALLPGDAPFVDLPLGATEDRLVGTLDLGAVLTGEGRRFEPGLLAAAHGGVLYVDEVNLLPDHLVDVLLDVAASGVNRVEREGISHEHAARFVLIGSMNPEEGELRPQLLDRFGLAVDLTTSLEPRDRAEAVRRRLDFDADPAGVAQRHASRRTGARHPPRVHHRRARARRAHGSDWRAVRGSRRRRAARRPRHQPGGGRPRRLERSRRGHRRRRPARRAHGTRPPTAPHAVRRAAGERARRRARRPRSAGRPRRPRRERDRPGTGRRTRSPAAAGRPPAREPRRDRSNRAPLTGRRQPRPPDRRPGAGRAGRRGRRRRHRPRGRRAASAGSGGSGGVHRRSTRSPA